MFEIFGIPSTALFGQLVLGLVDGSFYALLSLGLAVIFGMLNIVNFAHGAQYMMGAFVALLLLDTLGIGYWPALVLVPVIVGASGIAIERGLLRSASLTDMHWTMSGEVVLMTLVGGLGTFFGPVVGAVAIVAMQTYFASLGEWIPVIQGAILVACVLMLRRGIVGELAARLRIRL